MSKLGSIEEQNIKNRMFPFNAFKAGNAAQDATPILSLTSPWQFSGNGTVMPGAELLYVVSVAPYGYLRENGSTASRTTHSALYAVMSTVYGAGDASTTFSLPDGSGIESLTGRYVMIKY